MNTQPTRVAIIGCGSIGVGWAVVFARAGYQVRYWDPVDEVRERFAQEVRTRLNKLVDFDLLAADDIDRIVARIDEGATLASAVEDADYVQESGPERLEIKERILTDIEAAAPPRAVIASSSSAITASEMARGLTTQQRCLVVHPGNPPYLLPIAEVVPAPFTAVEIVERTVELLQGAGMATVRLAKEVPGFVFNRLQGAVLREAYALVEQGIASPGEIDQVMTHGLGRRWSVIGPFATSHLNVRGGIRAHAERMGESYRKMAGEDARGWSAELVTQVANELESALPLEFWDQWVAQRDEALMTLQRARQSGQVDVGSAR